MRRMASTEAEWSCSYEKIGFLPDVQRILAALPSKTQGKWQVGHYFRALSAPVWADQARRHVWVTFAPGQSSQSSPSTSGGNADSNNLKGMCFSATVPPKIKDVLSHVLNSNYTSISTLDESEPPTINGVPQFSVVIPKPEDIFPALLALLNTEIHANQGDSKIIVFGTTANLVALYAGVYGQLLPLKIFELHSRLNQNQRTKTSDAFRIASSGIMFATDGNSLL